MPLLAKSFGKVVFVQVMWKYLEQTSFPLTEAEYQAHLDNVANYLHAFGGTAQVQKFIQQTRDRPRLGKAVTSPMASSWRVP